MELLTPRPAVLTSEELLRSAPMAVGGLGNGDLARGGVASTAGAAE